MSHIPGLTKSQVVKSGLLSDIFVDIDNVSPKCKIENVIATLDFIVVNLFNKTDQTSHLVVFDQDLTLLYSEMFQFNARFTLLQNSNFFILSSDVFNLRVIKHLFDCATRKLEKLTDTVINRYSMCWCDRFYEGFSISTEKGNENLVFMPYKLAHGDTVMQDCFHVDPKVFAVMGNHQKLFRYIERNLMWIYVISKPHDFGCIVQIDLISSKALSWRELRVMNVTFTDPVVSNGYFLLGIQRAKIYTFENW